MDNFLGEIRMWSIPFAPQYWADCNGQIMSIQQNAALASLLGVQFGGDGRQTFGLPDLQGRTPVGYDGRFTDYRVGAKGGTEAEVLVNSEMAIHTHTLSVSSQTANKPYAASNRYLGQAGAPAFAPITGATQPLAPACVGITGKGMGHNNMQPFQVIRFCIALAGTYPARP